MSCYFSHCHQSIDAHEQLASQLASYPVRLPWLAGGDWNQSHAHAILPLALSDRSVELWHHAEPSQWNGSDVIDYYVSISTLAAQSPRYQHHWVSDHKILTLSVRGRPSITQVHALDPTCLYAPPADVPLRRWRELVAASWQSPMLDDEEIVNADQEVLDQRWCKALRASCSERSDLTSGLLRPAMF